MSKNLYFFILLLLTSLFLTNCSEVKPGPPIEPEPIVVRDTLNVWDYQYVKRTFFWINDPQILWKIKDSVYVIDRTHMPAGNSRIYVYADDNVASSDSSGFRSGYATARVIKDELQDRRFQRELKLMEEGVEYEIDLELAIIRFLSPLPDTWTVGISYTTQGGEKIGDVTGDTLQLRLLRPSQMSPASGCWEYELRNIYCLGNQFDANNKRYWIDIYRQNLTANGVDQDFHPLTMQPYLQILGLDRNHDFMLDGVYLSILPNFLFMPYFVPLIQAGDGKTYYPFELPTLDAPNLAIYNRRECEIQPELDRRYYFRVITAPPGFDN